MPKSFCEKCFKEVETGDGFRCPQCGADLSERRKRQEIESSREKAIELPWKKGIVAGVIVLALFATIRLIRSGDKPALYPGDKVLDEPCGMCKGPEPQIAPGETCPACRGSGTTKRIVYGPNHPGEVRGFVFDPVKREEYQRMKAASDPDQGANPYTRGIQSQTRLEIEQVTRINEEMRARAGGPAAYMEYMRKEREREEAAEKALAAELKTYGVAGAKIVVKRQDGQKFEFTADETGRFTAEVPPGKYTVTATHAQYETYTGEPTDVEFRQEMPSVQVGNVDKPILVTEASFWIGMKKK